MTFRDAGKKIDNLLRDLKARLGLVDAPSSITHLDRFDRWFTAPVCTLENELAHGDGAFVVMSVGFFLCERYFRSTDGASFKAGAATYFDINLDFFEDFWNIYRNGIQHQGSPKRELMEKKQASPNQHLNKPGYPIDYRWRIDSEYDSMPQKAVVGSLTYICIDPFGFTRRMLTLWHANEPKMAELTKHRLGEINPPTIIPTPVSVRAADPYP